jgi:hypothetical protein
MEAKVNFLSGKYQNFLPFDLVQSAWQEHTPFAMWVVEKLHPKLLVELGTHNGMSYLSMCQMVDYLGLPTKCISIDHWLGDKHAQFYSEKVFDDFQALNSKYSEFSSILRMDFEQGLLEIKDDTIELLSIDGFHTYEAVTKDFQNAFPKLNKEKCIILFHDINEYQLDFGVHRFWREIKSQYSNFEFHHEHGLGVLVMGDKIPTEISEFMKYSQIDINNYFLQTYFENLGQRVSMKYRYDQILKAHSSQTERLQELNSELEKSFGVIEKNRKEIDKFYNSRSFRFLKIPRKLFSIIRGIRNRFVKNEFN